MADAVYLPLGESKHEKRERRNQNIEGKECAYARGEKLADKQADVEAMPR
jgi:hypothetical protein